LFGARVELPRVLSAHIHAYLDTIDVACLYVTSKSHRRNARDQLRRASCVRIGAPCSSGGGDDRFPGSTRLAHELPLWFASAAGGGGGVRHLVAIWMARADAVDVTAMRNDECVRAARRRVTDFVASATCARLRSYASDPLSVDEGVLRALTRHAHETLERMAMRHVSHASNFNAGHALEDQSSDAVEMDAAIGQMARSCVRLRALVRTGPWYAATVTNPSELDARAWPPRIAELHLETPRSAWSIAAARAWLGGLAHVRALHLAFHGTLSALSSWFPQLLVRHLAQLEELHARRLDARAILQGSATTRTEPPSNRGATTPRRKSARPPWRYLRACASCTLATEVRRCGGTYARHFSRN
jgi:hypothetical protein